MATGPIIDQGKGKFLREFLASHRDARVEDATAAWNAEGHDDSISESLVSKIRAELGLTRKRASHGVATHHTGSKKAKASPNGSKSQAQKSEEAPLRPDFQEEPQAPSRSAFVEELLGREPSANLKKANEVWASEGHEGQISSSIFHKVKRERVDKSETPPIPSKSKPGRSRSEPKSSPPTPKTDQPAGASGVASSPVDRETGSSNPTPPVADRGDVHGSELHEIEGEIDELMFRLKGLGRFAEVQDALRTARRLLVRSHEH